jgi:IclR family acetate operon transcriptional repressor
MPQTARPLRRKSQTIERAGIILSCFSETRPHLSLSEFASRLGLNVNTVYRYVASLQTANLLRRDARRGGYSLGLRIIELAGIALNQIETRKQALDEMDRLRDELGLLVNLGVLLEGDVLHLAHAAPKDIPRMYTSLGRRAVAHCTASGKVLLAYRPWAEALRLIEEYGWRPYTARSIRGIRALQAELARTRRRGYGLDLEERRQGVVCVAAPIREQSGEVTAALSVSGSAERMTDRFCLKVAPRVVDTANRISYRLGYHGSSAYL